MNKLAFSYSAQAFDELDIRDRELRNQKAIVVQVKKEAQLKALETQKILLAKQLTKERFEKIILEMEENNKKAVKNAKRQGKKKGRVEGGIVTVLIIGGIYLLSGG